eukprot:TRINITY_DN1772_c0_g1_i1.p1 TRINITY_DN1772_c0_g1~~TRINITY_DN1772_c0_g1_i1.p1  ORF type:complete len:409 (+),score=64.78 TRINITY_DN1772_c0_g1_i1:223-1449(+)
MKFLPILVLLCALFASTYAWDQFAPSTIDLEGLVRIRCSLNESDEILFAFNGSVYAYPTNPEQFPRQLFKTVGLNIGRCFKRAEGNYTLVSREFLYYIDPKTDQIVNTWTNPYNNKVVTVMHVDNDPVLQTYNPGTTYPVNVEGGQTTLPLDIPLMYPNPLYFNPATKPYSPLANYQAGEFFKFIAPTSDVFSDRDSVSSVIVSWTRIGPWLPWMNMGNFSGFLSYSSHGSRVADWTYLPEQVRQDVANRVQRYQKAPTCVPAATVKSVTSWTFFNTYFNQYLAGTQFPLADFPGWACGTYPTPAPTACTASASATITSTWVSGGSTYQTVNIVLKNEGVKPITAISVSIQNTVIDNSWNIQPVFGQANTYSVSLWNSFAVGATLSGSYGFNSHNGVPAISVASVTCA